MEHIFHQFCNPSHRFARPGVQKCGRGWFFEFIFANLSWLLPGQEARRVGWGWFFEFIVVSSLLVILYCLFSILYYLLFTLHSLFVTFYCSVFTLYSWFFTLHPLLFTLYSSVFTLDSLVLPRRSSLFTFWNSAHNLLRAHSVRIVKTSQSGQGLPKYDFGPVWHEHAHGLTWPTLAGHGGLCSTMDGQNVNTSHGRPLVGAGFGR